MTGETDGKITCIWGRVKGHWEEVKLGVRLEGWVRFTFPGRGREGSVQRTWQHKGMEALALAADF